MKTAREVADELVGMVRELRMLEAVDELYGEDVVGVEAVDFEGTGRETRGKAAVREKGVRWLANNELHGVEVTACYASPEGFAMAMWFDRTQKAAGTRERFGEIGVYAVVGGEIVREEFFYL